MDQIGKYLYWLDLTWSSSFLVEGYIKDGFLRKADLSTASFKESGIFWVE